MRMRKSCDKVVEYTANQASANIFSMQMKFIN